MGVDAELAVRLRALAELIRDAHLAGRTPTCASRLDDSVDLPSRRRGRRRHPALAPSARCTSSCHACARRDWREMYGAILADFLTQAAALPAGR